MPALKRGVVLELARGLKLFLNLNVELTRGPATGSEQASPRQDRRLERMQKRLSELERRSEETAEALRRLGAELAEATDGWRAGPDTTGPSLLSYIDERGKRVLGFRDVAENGIDEATTHHGILDISRGDEPSIKARQAWYADLLAGRSWVLNLGCGRGEFLDLLRERGIKGKGVDADEGIVEQCRAKGHDDVVLGDVNVYLRDQEDGSVPAIFAAQLVEHLTYEELVEFLRLARSKLEVEGVLILEAVNYHAPEAIRTFWSDPTRRRPVLPEVLLALCKLAGFKSGRAAFPNRARNFEKELSSAPGYAVLATNIAYDPITEQEKTRRAALAQRRKSSDLRLCKVCDLPDWEDEEFRTLIDDLRFETLLDEFDYAWAEDRKHRKAWEWAKAIQGLEHLDALRPDATALGVGAGHEAPLYYLANHIREVHATDIYGSGDFAQGEGADEMLTNPQKFAPFPYREDRLVVRHMDGCDLEYPDESFDIAFSFSSIEHFGGHEAASQAMREMARVLRPGGIAVITTELILNDVPHHEFFLPEELNEYIVQPSGLELVEEIDFTISPSLLEKPVDLSTDYRDVFPHIVLKIGQVVFTSVLMFLQKPT